MDNPFITNKVAAKIIEDVRVAASEMSTVELAMTIGGIVEVYVERYGSEKAAAMFQSVVEEIRAHAPKPAGPAN